MPVIHIYDMAYRVNVRVSVFYGVQQFKNMNEETYCETVILISGGPLTTVFDMDEGVTGCVCLTKTTIFTPTHL